MDPDAPAPDDDMLSEAFFRDRNVADLGDEVQGPRRWVRGRLAPRVGGVLVLLSFWALRPRS